MVKQTQTIRQQKPTNCLSVFDHFVVLALKGLNLPPEQHLSLPEVARSKCSGEFIFHFRWPQKNMVFGL